MDEKLKKIRIIITAVALLLIIIVFSTPFLILRYADGQSFANKFKHNKDAFNTVKEEMQQLLSQENADELLLFVSYNTNQGLTMSYDTTEGNIIYTPANGDAYDRIGASFGEFCFHKIYVSNSYINIAEEGNNYQYIYCESKPTKAMTYGSNEKKMRKLGGNWYLVIPD